MYLSLKLKVQLSFLNMRARLYTNIKTKILSNYQHDLRNIYKIAMKFRNEEIRIEFWPL